jgi:hypothetical protein
MMATAMTSTPHGVYRERGGAEAAGGIYVSYGAHGFAVSEVYYRDQGLQPDLDTLPWKDEYEDGERRASDARR